MSNTPHSWYFIRLRLFKRSEVKWEGMRTVQAHYLQILGAPFCSCRASKGSAVGLVTVPLTRQKGFISTSVRLEIYRQRERKRRYSWHAFGISKCYLYPLLLSFRTALCLRTKAKPTGCWPGTWIQNMKEFINWIKKKKKKNQQQRNSNFISFVTKQKVISLIWLIMPIFSLICRVHILSQDFRINYSLLLKAIKWQLIY